MRKLRRLAALLLAMTLCCAALTGCKGSDGMNISVCVGENPDTLDPIYAETMEDQTILNHLYENLMRITVDASGNTSPIEGIAKSVSQEDNKDGTVTYTFRLRTARWSDGKAVRAQDFVYAWQRLANPASGSPYASLLSVVAGYQEARSSGDMSLLQVSAKNDTTLVVTLKSHYDWFLRDVCTAVATMPLRQDVVQKLKESNQRVDSESSWWSDPTAMVTNGSYTVSDYQQAEQLTAAASESYYGNRPGPKTITFRFLDPQTAWELYEDKELDALWPLPEEQLRKLAEDEDWTALPELETYSVLVNSNVLQDQEVRQLLAMTLDLDALEEIGESLVRKADGLVPPGVPEDEEGDFRTKGGIACKLQEGEYEERCARARELLSEAGYESGQEFGQLEILYDPNTGNGAVIQALCTQWSEALQLDITPVAVSERELWSNLRRGAYDLAAVNLKTDINDAEGFLMQWMSGAQNNVVSYQNSAFDTLLTIAADLKDGTARIGCLHDAEELLLNSAVIMPLHTHGTAWELRENLTGAFREPRGWLNFSGVVVKTA